MKMRVFKAVLITLTIGSLCFGISMEIVNYKKRKAAHVNITLVDVEEKAAPFRELPPGVTILCNERGEFTPLLSNEFILSFDSICSNKQDAIDRAWRAWGSNSPTRSMQRREHGSHTWTLCQ